MQPIVHDPNSNLPYKWDWNSPDWAGRTWLDGDTISTATVTSSDAGVNITNVNHDDTTVTAWISGGTTGATIKALCHITTTGGRTDDRSMYLLVRNR